jgi:hypothetical protein
LKSAQECAFSAGSTLLDHVGQRCVSEREPE